MRSPHPAHRLRAAGPAVLLAIVAGCTSGEPAPPEPPALVATTDNVGTWSLFPSERDVVAIGGSPLRVLRPVTLESVELEMEHGEVEALEFRVSLFACAGCRPRSDVVGYAGHAGSVCSHGPWPPPGYGPSYPVAGFTLEPGDWPSLLVYARRRTAEAESRAFVVTYVEAGERHQVRITTDRLKILPPRTPSGERCEDTVWFGGKNNPEVKLVKPLTGSPSATPPRSP